MPFKSKAQRRKFAELLVKGEISPEVYEEWNRETGRKEAPGTRREEGHQEAREAGRARQGREAREGTSRKEVREEIREALNRRRSGTRILF